jgi:hypothetical protein
MRTGITGLKKERDMKGRIVHRGIVALAIVTSLSFAGARPAAAANLNLLERFSHLWSIVTGTAAPVAHQQSARTPKIPGKSTTTPTPTDRGWGIDPNGNSLSGTAQGNG